jgi:hypothetical protein
MATRSNIAIILKEEDKARVFAELNERLEDAGNRFRYGVDNGNVLQIYCHWDGYPEGVGEDLLRDFNSYDEALKLILEGDHSTPYEPYTGRGESWVSNRPDQRTEPRCEEEYLYVFKDGKWKMPAEDGIIKECIDTDGYCTIEDYLDREF